MKNSSPPLMLEARAVWSPTCQVRCAECYGAASDWMASLDDTRPLSSLTIPGTHDSGALYSIADVAGKCQSLSIAEQLKLGVRFFDIRLQLRGDKLAVVHSFVDQMTDFADVLQTMTAFLEEHPTEVLIVSIKEDAAPKNAKTSFADAVESMLASSSAVRCDRTLPKTLAEARGGMYLIARYQDATVGIPAYDGWQDNAAFALGELYIQDRYAVEGVSEKQEQILKTLTDDLPQSSLILHFTSCYLTSVSYPPTNAAVPAKDILPWLCETQETLPDVRGVILCDYMTSEISEIIRRCNDR